jgi:uncharacterized membrane protein YphA (DoxX/SURF4 family)
MKIALGIVSGLLAAVFIASGFMKLFAFDQLAHSAPSLADQHGLVIFIGLAEVAGAMGLIVPRLTGIQPTLSTWAAVGLATIMVLATGFHLVHGEYSHVPVTVILFGMAAFLAYGLFKGMSREVTPT